MNQVALPPDYSKIKDKCERYAKRLDDHLLTLADAAARKAFCERELNKWIDRFETFKVEVDTGRYDGDATAFDFHITMADVTERIHRYSTNILAAG